MNSDTVSAAAPASRRGHFGRLDRWARALVARHRLQDLHGGQLTLSDSERSMTFGDADGPLRCRVDVRHPRFYRRALLGGSLGAAAAYLDGDWDCDDLAALFRLFVRAADIDSGTARLAFALARLGHLGRRNTRGGSRRNIRDHYDLGNDLFCLFLDQSMTYSAGVFDPPGVTLEQAQQRKLDRICRKLDLRPEHHVLEIGTGWGSFALHAARHYGCRVTTTTISCEQHALACERIEAAGLADRVTLLTDDYRDLDGRYDRLVSIEMIEAVGHEHLETFFGVCAARLRANGRMVLQSITAGDDWYDQYRRTVDFVQRYVFPGGLCPSLGAMTAALGRASDLRVSHIEDLTHDYAQTLRHWRRRFLERADDVRALGYPERFLRLWNYYLQYCEAGFAERHTGTLQIVLDKPGTDAPAVRAQLGGAPA